ASGNAAEEVGIALAWITFDLDHPHLIARAGERECQIISPAVREKRYRGAKGKSLVRVVKGPRPKDCHQPLGRLLIFLRTPLRPVAPAADIAARSGPHHCELSIRLEDRPAPGIDAGRRRSAIRAGARYDGPCANELILGQR